MRVKLAYGKTGLDIELPDDRPISVVEPRFIPGLPDPSAAIRNALNFPFGLPSLRNLVRSTEKVGIIISDITRPSPNQLLLLAILDEITHIPRENITLFVALGTHRPNTKSELCSMIGEELVERYRIIQNQAFEPSTQTYLGLTSLNHEIWLNREIAGCELLILTGFIEPHFFAGFSGGGKALMPGMAGLRTVLGNHDAGMIANPKATWGITYGNPIWEEAREVALKFKRVFLLNVALNKLKEITGVFAGELDLAHATGCGFVKQNAMVPISQQYDIVITTNSGYPLDINLYQSVKGMSAAAQVVKRGGAIIIAAECLDGIPEHGLYRRLLCEAGNPQILLQRILSPGFLELDQWQAQVQAQIQLKADVFVYSDNLTDDQIREALLYPCRDIEGTISNLLNQYGSEASICILPEGPQTIPFIG